MAESRRYFSEIMNMNNDNHMDTEEDDEEKTTLFKEPMRRNLLSVFDNVLPAEVADERMSVFLRIRPFSEQEVEHEENQGCVEVQNSYMVSAKAPKDSHTYQAQQYGLKKAKHNFTFSRVFPETTSQKQFFDNTMLKLVQDFIEGQNCLVFTYGVTNSGKTYTIQGNAHDAGILPRGLDVLFNSISGRQWPRMDLKPRMFCDVCKLSPEEEEKEQKIKEKTLKLYSSQDLDVMTLLGNDASSDQSAIDTTQQSDTDGKGSVESGEALMADLENRDREETAVDVSVQGQIRFTVWVSFAEIYNEQIFDLLEPLPKKKDARRTVLKLSEDRKGSPYIKGLKEIHVTSADEAYKLLTIGQRNLKTACTRLNQCSSRSHCIFNIKIIRVPDKGDPKMARVSMLSLCDLAGSERQSKTHTTGDRVKEAGNINTSLLTLGRCIELLRYNQHHKDKEKIIPFRESRLTRLFQNFFCGRGKASMIVNVSQCASMFDETLNVFKFSAIAKQVVMPPKPAEKPPEPKKKRKTGSKATSRASSICWETAPTPSRISRQSAAVGAAEEDLLEEEEEEDEDEEISDDQLYIESLEEELVDLRKKMRDMKHQNLVKEAEIRREVCTELQEQFVQIEDTYSYLLSETRRQEADKFEKKLQLIMEYSQPQPSKRPRLDLPSTSKDKGAKGKDKDVIDKKDVMVDDDDEWVSSLLLHQEKVKVQEREKSLGELRAQVTELQFQVADMTKRSKELTARAQKAEEAQRQAEKDCAEKVAQAERLREAAATDAKKAEEDLSHSVLVETLSQQLTEARDRLKEKDKEIGELKEMLNDAGETFQQKEEEISKLKQAIADDEDSAKQQMETIRELRGLLEESKAAVEDSERRLEARNTTINTMKEELKDLQARLSQKETEQQQQDQGKGEGGSESSSDAEGALKKCQEELSILRGRLKHEEQDFQQREKALIHGYTAEINNLKSQMALLKSRNLGKCVGTSPMRVATPEASPSRGRLGRKLGGGGGSGWKKGRKRKVGGGEMDDSFHHQQQAGDSSAAVVDLLHRLKEVSKDPSVTPELRQKLQELQSAAEWLQQQAGERGEVEERLQQTQQELQELQHKFGEMSAASSEITRQLDNRKELHAELTDNQSESAELRQKLMIAESAAEDLEKRLTSASQQSLKAEASKAQVNQELSHTKNLLIQAENKISEHTSEVKDLRTALQSLTESNSQLTADCESYRMMIDSRQAQESRQTEDRVSALKKELSHHQQEAEKARERNEELQTMVDELKSMLNHTSAQLETASSKLKELEKQEERIGEQKHELESKASNEAMLQSALSEANQQLQDKTLKCQELQTRISKNQAEIDQLKSSLESAEKAELEARSYTESLQAELKEKESALLEARSQTAASSETAKSELQDRQRKMNELRTKLETAKSTLAKKERKITDLTQEREEALKAARAGWEETQRKLEQQLQAARDEKLKECEHCHELSTKLASTEQMLESVKCKESDRLAKMQSLEKAQKEAKKVQDRKLVEAQEELRGLKASLTKAQSDLAAKVTEATHLKESLTQLNQTSSSDAAALQGKLSEASMIIAELKSTLHMEQALTHRHKSSAQEASQQSQQLEASMASLTSRLEKAEKEKAILTEEVSTLKARVSELETTHGEMVERLEKELSSQHKTQAKEALAVQEQQQLSAKVDALQTKLKELETERDESRESHRKACTELDSAKAELSRLERELAITQDKRNNANIDIDLGDGDQDKLKTKLDSLKAELDSARKELDSKKEELEVRSKELDTAKATISSLEQSGQATSMAMLGQGGEVGTVKAGDEELDHDLQAEKRKNEELQKQIKALSTIDAAADAPGSLRRLRKEKIQAESEVVNARFEVERLQRQVERLLNVRDANPRPSPSPVKCQSCATGRASALEQVTTLRQTLTQTSKRLQEEETVRQRLECQLLEVKAKLLSAEGQLTEVKATRRDPLTPLGAGASSSLSLSSSGVKVSSGSSSSRDQDAYSLLQTELEKSREKEGALRKELQACAEMMDTVDTERSQLEEQLALKTEELDRALQQKKELKTDDHCGEKLQQQVDSLIGQLEAKDERLIELKGRLTTNEKDLARTKEQCRLAEEDCKESERVIQQLKDAIVFQEETMDKQDRLLSQNREEITSLNAELQKVTSDLDSLAQRHSSLQEEKKALDRHHSDINSKLTKVWEEKNELQEKFNSLKVEHSHLKGTLTQGDKMQEKIDSLTAEIGRLKGSLTTGDKASASLQEKIDSLTAENLQLKETRSDMDQSLTLLQKKLEGVEKELCKVKKSYKNDTERHLAKEEKWEAQEHKLKRWREERDKLAGELESELNQRSEKIKELSEELDRCEKMMGDERREKEELRRQLKLVQRAKDSIMGDLRHANHQLQVQLALAQGEDPPPAPLPPSQHQSFRVNDSDCPLVDDVDTTGHLEVDATPPVAAKNLRKGRKRTTASLNRSNDSSDGGSKTRRKGRGKKQDVSMEVVPEEGVEKSVLTPRLPDLQDVNTGSPLTRSARRLLQVISPDRRTNSIKREIVTPADTPVDTPAGSTSCRSNSTPATSGTKGSSSKRGSRKVTVKVEEEVENNPPPRPALPAPFECAPFQAPTTETRQSRRLRQRRGNPRDQTAV